jgi:DNA-binding transcriptional ArsR family regulator
MSIATLTDGAGITRQAVTKHLAVLAGAGLVHDSRHGRERLWTLDAPRLAEARHRLEEISHRWDDALDRLRIHVEG